jgi:hypothetical protein
VTACLALGLAMSVPACNVKLRNDTAGAEGKVTFAYTSWSCLFGCELDRPMLVGTEENISMQGDGADDAGVTVASSDPHVARASIDRSCVCEQTTPESTSAVSAQPGAPCASGFTRTCTNDIRVDAVGAGSAELTVRQADGTMLDRTTVQAAKAARIVLLDPDTDQPLGGPVSVAVGGHVGVRTRVLDAEGHSLLTTKGIEWTTTGAVSVEPFCFFCETGSGSFVGNEKGTGTLTATAKDATATASVTVHE